MKNKWQNVAFAVLIIFSILVSSLYLREKAIVPWEYFDKVTDEIYENLSKTYTVGDLVDNHFIGNTNMLWATTDNDIVNDHTGYPMRKASEIIFADKDFECYAIFYYAPEVKNDYYMGAFRPDAARRVFGEEKVDIASRLVTSKGMLVEVLALSPPLDSERNLEMVVAVDNIANNIQEFLGEK